MKMAGCFVPEMAYFHSSIILPALLGRTTDLAQRGYAITENAPARKG